MTWMFWLLAPLTAIAATAVLTWWSGRPRRPVPLERALREHRLYLSDLAEAAETRSTATFQGATFRGATFRGTRRGRR